MDQCPACGEPVDVDHEFCPGCGVRLDGATASFEVVGEEAQAAYLGSEGLTEVPVLIVRKGVEIGERFYLEQPRICVGRDPACDIFLNDVTVSRSHAILTVEGDQVRLADVGSLNGTYVNDAIVTEAILASGDVVQIGRFQMVFLTGGGA